MQPLTDIPGIDHQTVELLDLAGIRDIQHLATQEAAALWAEISRANGLLAILEQTPDQETVEQWINFAATEIVEEPAPNQDENDIILSAVNYEGNEQVLEMIAAAPCAIPMPGRLLMEQKLRVSDIPAGLLLNRYSGDLDVRIGSPETPRDNMPQRLAAESDRANPQRQKLGLDTSQIKMIAPETTTNTRLPGSKDSHKDDRVALIRTPRESTNRGKNPESRRYVRGVLHTNPWSLRTGAICSLVLILLLPLSVVSAFLLLLSRQDPETFEWVPTWILAFPISLPVIGICYLLWGISGKCRICTQKLFAHKAALKHVKAHQIQGLGYVLPLCLHLLLFSWFRCSSCGTPVRLKK